MTWPPVRFFRCCPAQSKRTPKSRRWLRIRNTYSSQWRRCGAIAPVRGLLSELNTRMHLVVAHSMFPADSRNLLKTWAVGYRKLPKNYKRWLSNPSLKRNSNIVAAPQVSRVPKNSWFSQFLKWFFSTTSANCNRISELLKAVDSL